MIVSELLRQARTRAELTQQELAARVGTTQSAIARMEAGSSSPRIETVERLLEASGFRLRLTLVPIAPADGVVGAYRSGIDRTLLRENLRKSPEQRVRALTALQELASEARRAGRARRRA